LISVISREARGDVTCTTLAEVLGGDWENLDGA
jgi:hypothetical protein